MRTLGFALVATVAFAGPAAAQTFTVLNTDDTGADSLRAAITAANAAGSAAVIDFNISGGGTINLLSALPNLTNATGITINGSNGGANNIVVSGQNSVRPFFVDSAAASFAISNLTVLNGRNAGGAGGPGWAAACS